jgi:hypothetical protein
MAPKRAAIPGSTRQGRRVTPSDGSESSSPELVKELRAAADAHDKAKRDEIATRRHLHEVLGRADDDGVPVAVLTWATRLSRQRIYQIRRSRESDQAEDGEPLCRSEAS